MQTIIHIPHASTEIPANWRGQFCIDEESLRQELIRMTDWYTDELFGYADAPDCHFVRAPYSRLVCDMERFRDPAQEGMTARGMWICYEKTADGRRLKRQPADTAAAAVRLDAAHIAEVLAAYDRHHAALTAVCGETLAKAQGALLIDAHSFPSAPLPYELAAGNSSAEDHAALVRPDFCLGTDPVHTPPALAEAAERFLVERGYTVAYNKPFAGVLVPMAYYRKDPRLAAIMIEVNRALYIDERTAEELPDGQDGKTGFVRTRQTVWELISVLRETKVRGQKSAGYGLRGDMFSFLRK